MVFKEARLIIDLSRRMLYEVVSNQEYSGLTFYYCNKSCAICSSVEPSRKTDDRIVKMACRRS